MTPEQQTLVAAIRQVVCTHFCVSQQELDGRRKGRIVAAARRTAMAMVRERTDLSTVAIGKAFGNKHHTTVVLACQAVEHNTLAPYLRLVDAHLNGEKTGSAEIVRNSHDGSDSPICTCPDTCPGACRGECGCRRCHEDYQDFLSARD